MAAFPKLRLFTSDEYLLLERQAFEKSEFVHGEIYGMAGSSPEHDIICGNITGELHSKLRGLGCREYTSNMKVRTSDDGVYSYPDASVVCGTPQFHDDKRDVLTNPIVIFEVLSPSTKLYDMNTKLQNYQSIPSVVDIVLLDQLEPSAECYHKSNEGEWINTTVRGLDALLDIESINCSLSLSDLYRDLDIINSSK
jgi:Uma2 family endonuclease